MVRGAHSTLAVVLGLTLLSPSLALAEIPSLELGSDGTIDATNFPAVGPSGWVAVIDDWTNDAGDGSKALVLIPASGSAVRIVLERYSGDGSDLQSTHRQQRSLQRARRLLKRHAIATPLSLYRWSDSPKPLEPATTTLAQTMALQFTDASGRLVATKKSSEGVATAAMILPRGRIDRYCCDAESTTGTCDVQADLIEAYAEVHTGIVLVRYAHAIGHQADGCQTRPRVAIVRVPRPLGSGSTDR